MKFVLSSLGLIIICTYLSSVAYTQQKKKRDLLAIPEVTRDKVICFALYTVNEKTLKLTAQFYPLTKDESREAKLEILNNGNWKTIAKTKIIERGWTAPFRVENWDDSKKASYRVSHGKNATYEGIIQKNPVDKTEFVVAGFTGNSINPNHGGDIPKNDLVQNIKKIKPDLLFFSGDQVYDHRRHYAAWLKFGRDFGEVIRNIPTITIPDDHDVGQPNIWGHGGKKSTLPGAADGGYAMPVEYVKEVERAQTSHLPDPYDPTPIQRGIGTYYTDLNWGRISFAIIEDRKFKTGPAGMIPKQGPRPDHIRNPEYDPKSVDVPEARLLGERQLKFLDDWGQDWTDSDVKVALSQTIFCGGAHIHGKIGGRLHADLDSNGWPQAGRNRAISALRKAYAFHFAGDQHLATIFHHGIEEHRDSIYSFCVPSIANLYLRWWKPLEPGKNLAPGQDPILGDHLDGFHNKVTALAVANPSPERGGDKLTTRAAGFGVVNINKETRNITFTCWPRNIDITNEKAKPYKGWPFTFNQLDNYGRKAVAHLPTLKINKPNQVVQLINERNNETVYTIRVKGSSFKPKVFENGTYTIKGGEKKNQNTLKSIGTDSKKEYIIIKI
ncbi:MAG: alkaline phosphatase D family protein [Verrucomicrobiota bacterium]|nr:alkaline phosphatase D family protein [Verrucomicrobiota bacterium]